MDNSKQIQGSVYHCDEVDQEIQRHQKFFKPISLRTPVLSILLAATLVLISVIEVTSRRLPNSFNRGIVGTLDYEKGATIGRRHLVLGRQASSSATRPTGTYEVTSTQTISGVVETIVITWAPSPTSTPTLSTNYFTDNKTANYAPASSSGARVDSLATNYLQLGIKTLRESGSAPKTPTPTPTPVPAPAPSPSAEKNVPITQIIPASIDSSGNSVPAVTILVAPSAQMSVPGMTIPTSISSKKKTASTSTSSGLASSTTKVGKTVVIPGSTYVLFPTDAPVTSDTGDVLYYFSNRDYVLGAFLPTIIAVLFTIPWSIIDNAAKEMEPFVRLANGEGASARFSLCLDYPGEHLLIAPIKSLFRGHWIIFLTSIMSIISLILAPLASEAVFISLRGTCNSETDARYCIPTLAVYRPAAKVLQAVLAMLAFILLLVIIFARRRLTGVYANPHSLAAVATLFHQPQLVDIFRSIPPDTREKELIKFLQAYNYRLGNYHQNQRTAYGLLVNPRDSSEPVGYSHISLNNAHSLEPLSIKRGNGWILKLKRALQVLLFAIALLALASAIVWYRYNDSINFITRFMESQSFGVSFLFTTFGVLIRLFWDRTRTAIHKHEPYYNLKKGAHASSTVLLTPSPNPLLGMFHALSRFAIFQFIIDLSTVLCDALTVALSNIPFSSGTTYDAFIICLWISVSILGFMIITLFILLVRIGRFGGDVAVPSTLGGKMKLLVGSHIIERFRTLGDMDKEQRDKAVGGMAANYKLGMLHGVDGIRREGVDFEEFVHN